MPNENLNIDIKVNSKEANKRLQDISNNLKSFNKNIETSTKAIDKNSKATNALLSELKSLGLAYLGLESIKAIITISADIEEGFLSVAKTTGLAGEELEVFKDSILEMSTTLAGVKIDELQAISEMAGQLGIKGTENLLQFTETIAKVAVTTDLTAEEASTNFAKLSNILNEPISNVTKLGDVMNELSNTTASTVGEMTDLGKRIAASAENIGLATPTVFALSATILEMGETAEVAGTAISQILGKMLTDTQKFADISGMELSKFRDLLVNDVEKALIITLERLSELDKFSQIETIKKLGFDGQNAIKVLQKLSGGVDKLTKNIQTANKEYKVGGSMTKEYETFSQALNKQLDLLMNTFKNIANEIGVQLLPQLKELIVWFKELYDQMKESGSETTTIIEDLGLTLSNLGTAVGNLLDPFSQLAKVLDGTSEKADKSGFKVISEQIVRMAEFVEFATRTLTDWGLETNNAISQTKNLSKAYDELGTDLTNAKEYIKLFKEGSQEAITSSQLNTLTLMDLSEEIKKQIEVTKKQIEVNKSIIETKTSNTTMSNAERDAVVELSKENLNANRILRDYEDVYKSLINVTTEKIEVTKEQTNQEIGLITSLTNSEIVLNKLIERNRELYEVYKNGTTKEEKELVKALEEAYSEQTLSLEKVKNGKEQLTDDSITLTEKELTSLEFYAKKYNEIQDNITFSTNSQLEERFNKFREFEEKRLATAIETSIKQKDEKQKLNDELLQIEEEYQQNILEIQKGTLDTNLDISQAITELKVNEVEDKKEIDNSYNDFVREDLQKRADLYAQEREKQLQATKESKEKEVSLLMDIFNSQKALATQNTNSLIELVKNKNLQIEELNKQHQLNLEDIAKNGLEKQKAIQDIITDLNRSSLNESKNQFEIYQSDIRAIEDDILSFKKESLTQTTDQNQQTIDTLISQAQNYANQEIEVDGQILLTKEESNNKAISLLEQLSTFQTQVTEQQKTEAEDLHNQQVAQLNREIDLAKVKLEGEKAVIEALKEMYSLFSGEAMQVDTSAIEEALTNIDNLREGIEKTSQTPLDIDTQEAQDSLKELDEADKKFTDDKEARGATATITHSKRITYLGNLQKQTTKEVGTDYSVYENHINSIDTRLEEFKKNSNKRTYTDNKAILDKLIQDAQQYTDEQVVEDGRIKLSKEDVRNTSIKFLEEIQNLSNALSEEELKKEKEVHDEKVKNKDLELLKLNVEIETTKALITAITQAIEATTGLKIEPQTKELDNAIAKLKEAQSTSEDITATPIDVKANSNQVVDAKTRVTELKQKADDGAIVNIDSDTQKAEDKFTIFEDKANNSITTSTHKIDIKLDEINKALTKLDNTKTTSIHSILVDNNKVKSVLNTLNNTITYSMHYINVNADAVWNTISLIQRPTYSWHYIYIQKVYTNSQGGLIPSFADGGTFKGSGRVAGYDSQDTDSVKANLDKGSFVINRRATDKIGRENLDKISYNARLTKGEYVFSPMEVSNIGVENLENMNAMGFSNGGIVNNNTSNLTNNKSNPIKVDVYIDGIVDKTEIANMALDGITKGLKSIL